MSHVEIHNTFNAHFGGSEKTCSKYWIQKSSTSQIYLTQEHFVLRSGHFFSKQGSVEHTLCNMRVDKSYFSSIIVISGAARGCSLKGDLSSPTRNHNPGLSGKRAESQPLEHKGQ